MLIPTPIGTCYAHQLEWANLACMLYMWAATEIKKVVLLIDCNFSGPFFTFVYLTEFRKVVLLLVNTDLLLIWQVFDNFNFIGLSFLAKVFQCFET